MLRSLAGSVKRNWALLALVVGLILVLVAVVALITGTELAVVALLLAASITLSGLALVERQGTRLHRNARRIHKSVVDAEKTQRASGEKTRANISQASTRQQKSIDQLRSSVDQLRRAVDDTASQQRAAHDRLAARISDMEGARRLDEAMREKEREAFQDEALTLIKDRLDVADATALLNLFHLLPLEGPLTLPTSFTASPRTMLSLVTEVLSQTNPPTVVECGSGASTVWMAAACQRRGAGSVIALEHHSKYADETAEMIRLCGLSDFAEVRNAPLQPHTIDGEQFQWYDATAHADLTRIDLLFVDGPPGRTGPFARYPALPLLSSALTSGALVVVDDIERQQEAAVVKRWMQAEPFHHHLTERSRAGRAALLRWQAPGDAGEVPAPGAVDR